MPPSFTRGIVTFFLEQMVRTLGVKPTAWTNAAEFYSGDRYYLSRTDGQNPRREADGIDECRRVLLGGSLLPL